MSFFGRLGLFLAGVLTGTITTIYALRHVLLQRFFVRQTPRSGDVEHWSGLRAKHTDVSTAIAGAQQNPGDVSMSTTREPPQPAWSSGDLRRCTARSCLGPNVTSIHRSVLLLATGPSRFSVFHTAGFFPLYVSTTDEDAAALFNQSASGIWFPVDHFWDLPFVDFAADLIVLDVAPFVSNRTMLSEVLTETVRMLAQLGVLFLLGGEEFPNLALEQLSAAKQLEPGAMRQSFVRKLGLVPDLPTCPNCGMTPMMGQRHQRPSPQNLCQAWVQPDYLSIFDPEVRGKFEASSESWELQRLRLWHRPNVLDSREEVKNWVKKVSTSDRAWYNDNYVSSEPNKREWRFSQLITEGKVKRLLDAGAGSCTLEGTLRRQRLLSKLDVYLAFGAYDCSMLRICAERGALSFQQNWLKQMPICASCKFDLIFQVEGLHHNKDVEAHGLFLQNMLSHLACGGLLYVQDGFGPWVEMFHQALTSQHDYKVKVKQQLKDDFYIHRLC